MLKRILSAAVAAALILCLAGGCASRSSGNAANTVPAEDVTLHIVGPWEESTAIEALSSAFTKEYPNCTVEYEYIQDYYDALETRLGGEDSGIDLFVTKNIQSDSALLPYALELFSQGDALDLSGTFDGLIQNFTYINQDKNAAPQIYAVPFGAEIRGMYVNTTLLSSLGLSVPTNRSQLLAACKTLSEAGYIPLQGNPGNFGQWLMYPYICNMIANAADYDDLYQRINSREAGISDYFRDPMEFLYTLVENGYYNYKYVETTYGLFSETGSDAYARDFMNIAGENGNYQKVDDVGTVAFMPGVMSLDNTIAKLKDDYHSGIEYQFVLSPVGNDGGYAYLSPSEGLAINKNSANTQWALKYMNFLFIPENNKLFAEEEDITPNTTDAFDLTKEKFNIGEDHISQLGSVTFDYPFYTVISDTLTEISKANNPKYMIDNGDGTHTMYSFAHFMENFENRFQQS